MQNGKMKYLSDVLHVSNITKNLVSVGQMIEQGFQVRFNFDGCYVEDPKEDLIYMSNTLMPDVNESRPQLLLHV